MLVPLLNRQHLRIGDLKDELRERGLPVRPQPELPWPGESGEASGEGAAANPTTLSPARYR